MTVAAYLLLLVAALLRVFGGVAGPDALAAFLLAALCWVVAFSLFLAVFGPCCWGLARTGNQVSGGWAEYAAAWLVFLLSHMLPARPRMRLFLVALLGRRGHLAAYSLVSVLVLAWLIAATGRAPRAPVWSPAAWQAWVPAVVVPMACVLLALGLGIPNPFSIGGAHPNASIRHGPVCWC